MVDGIVWYGGGSLVEAKKYSDKKGFSEFVVRGNTKFFYIMEQNEPQLSVSSDSDLRKFFKLGYASKPKLRLSQLKSSNPFDIRLIFEYETPQPKTLEFLVHNFFNSYHHRGEWYLIDSEMMTGFIQKRIFDLFIQKSGALGYSDARMGYDHRMFLEETK